MLSPELRRKVHELWTLFWTAGLSNPLVAIEQITYLLFIHQLEKLDRERVKEGKPSIYSKVPKEHTDFEKCRWSYIRKNPSFELLEGTVFPWLRSLQERLKLLNNQETSLQKISGRLTDAHFILDPNKTEVLKGAINLIDDLFRLLDGRSVNADIMGDTFEYLLEEVRESGKHGQFRTPRHLIRFMVELLDPKFGKLVLDPACGSAGFLLNTLLYWKMRLTDPELIRFEWDGAIHDTNPRWPKRSPENLSKLFRGYDNDRTMVRIAWMNLILHGLESPEVYQLDALSGRLPNRESRLYDYVLANPPFTGNVDESDLSKNRDRFPGGKGENAITTKSELLFAWLILDLLKVRGRSALVIPDGVLFGPTKAHRQLRRLLLFENYLEGVISLPQNIFQPYSGVKTSVLIFQKFGKKLGKGVVPRTGEVWFYEVDSEAYSLDQKRRPLYAQDNDFWDAIVKFAAWRTSQNPRLSKTSSLAERKRSISTNYYQPEYWQERWRNVDEKFLQIFPEKSHIKGQALAIHELWSKDFQFNRQNLRGARQYDEAIIHRHRRKIEKIFRGLVRQTITFVYTATPEPDQQKAISAIEKTARLVINQFMREARESGVLDHEFDQFGLGALKSVLREVEGKLSTFVQIPATKRVHTSEPVKEPKVQAFITRLRPLLKDFAKLDGYNIWRRGAHYPRRQGKLSVADEPRSKRQKVQLSWIAPVREWAVREFWGEDPDTHEVIHEPTHADGVVRPEYLEWLKERLRIFDNDNTVRKEHLDRLTPDCIEALDFNLSANRYKPFIIEATTHEAPSKIIRDLKQIYSEMQRRLELLEQIGGSK